MEILIVGAGQMGSGIAQVAAQSGFAVWLTDAVKGQADRGREAIQGRLERLVQKNALAADVARENLDRVYPISSPEDAGACDLVIEAIVEDEATKAALFRRLDASMPPHTVLASNTSSISITRLAAETRRPTRVLGMHFFNPVPVMELVEVIRGEQTGDAAVDLAMSLALQMGKTPVEVQDFPGFAANRILIPMINEAIFALQEGVASREAIDTVMRLGARHPIGPLALADLIGLDTCLAILEVLYRGYGDPKYRPAPLLRRMVDARRLGRKTGEGFYRYQNDVAGG